MPSRLCFFFLCKYLQKMHSRMKARKELVLMNKEIDNQESKISDEKKEKVEEFVVSGHYAYGFGMNFDEGLFSLLTGKEKPNE